ncbi:DinB family protein [Dictyobacter formicarum]|uniref:DinB-like domain-containing protein n=1 Tax=Dictyobacter formicarum TaxID=2778368 RepID=A0ABQ3VHT6_9CHLR|nr:DinB family protein [Dictyobacter formicarum]GHO85754.1 hypothetical protein KSZ_37600 [Dictyobacter formicarum]
MDKATFVTTLVEQRGEWEALLARFDVETMRLSGAAGKWSVKDVVAHVAWSEHEMVPVMQSHVLSGSELWNVSEDERNEVVYQQNEARSLQEVVADEQKIYAQFLQAVQELSEEDFHDPRRFKYMPADWVPWQIFAGCSFKHYEDHMPSLQAWLVRRGPASSEE